MSLKYAWLVLCVCLGFAANAQNERYGLQQVCRQFDSALIKKDTARLNLLLMDGFKMKHSNGLAETKKELLQHLCQGVLKYDKIIQNGEASVQYDEELGFVDRNLEVSGALNGRPFKVKLKAAELWSWSYDTKQWRLKWRQSVKINNR